MLETADSSFRDAARLDAVRDRLVDALARVCAVVDVKLRALDPDLSGSVRDDGVRASMSRRRLRWGRDDLEDVALDALGVDRSVDLPPWRPEPGSPDACEQQRVARLGERMEAGEREAGVAWRLAWWRHQAGVSPARTGSTVRHATVSLRVQPRTRGLRSGRRSAGRRGRLGARSPDRLGDDDPEPPLARLIGEAVRHLAAAVAWRCWIARPRMSRWPPAAQLARGAVRHARHRRRRGGRR